MVLRAVAQVEVDCPGAELVGDEQEARAEALDLQRPVRLPVQAVPNAAGREPHERQENDRDHAREDGRAQERLPPSVAPPDIDERGRHDDDREDLGRSGEPKYAESGTPVLREHRGQAEHQERRRPEVEAGQDHGTERERRQRREAERGEQTLRLCTQGAECDRCACDREEAAEHHQPLEVPPIDGWVVPIANRR